MPELPDLQIYFDAIESRACGTRLERIQINNPFVLRSVDPPLDDFAGRKLRFLSLIGKRLVFEFDEEVFLVIHLMIAGRFRWYDDPAKVTRKTGLAALVFESGALVLTEAGKKRRASITAVRGRDTLREMDRGGLSIFDCNATEFADRVRGCGRTIKRALCDPTVVSGIGNAFSDEILHAAKLSPFKRTADLTDAELCALLKTAKRVILSWTDLLRTQTGAKFPAKVTAFRPEMAAHGKAGEACPECGTAIQRIKYADNETNYCPGCQTGGKLLKDRALSQILKSDWPRSVEELEDFTETRKRR